MIYIVMVLMISGAALTDFVTGYLKAYIQGKINSQKMRIGGVHKICELLILIAVIGLDNGLDFLGKYYQSEELAEIAGSVSVIGVFVYVMIMEIVSILENLSDIFPQAEKIKKLIKKLKILGSDEK